MHQGGASDEGISDTIAGAYDYTADGSLFLILKRLFSPQKALFHNGKTKSRDAWGQ